MQIIHGLPYIPVIIIIGIMKSIINMVKTIKISEETHTELNNIGVRGESFEDIVKRLIKVYKENKKK